MALPGAGLTLFLCTAGGSGKRRLKLRQLERERDAWTSAASTLGPARSSIPGGVGYASIPLALYYEANKTVDHQVQAALDLGESVRAHLRVVVQREDEMRRGIINAQRERAIEKIREREQKAAEKREKKRLQEASEKEREDSRLSDCAHDSEDGSAAARTGDVHRKSAKRSKSPGIFCPDMVESTC